MDQVFGVDFTQTLQRKGGSSAMRQQPFQVLAVRRFETHASVEREAAIVIPVRHRLGICRLEHSAAGQRAQQTGGSSLTHSSGQQADPEMTFA